MKHFNFRWAQENRAKLSSQHSSLEFKLHRLHFIDLVKQGAHKQLEALNYARQFAAFASSHQTGEFSNFMRCTVRNCAPQYIQCQ